MTGNSNQFQNWPIHPATDTTIFFLTFIPGVIFGICFDSGVHSARWTKESHTTEGWKHKAHHLEHGSFQVLNREEMIFLAIPSKALLAVVQLHTCYGKSSKKIICRSKAPRVLGCGKWSWSLFQSPPFPTDVHLTFYEGLFAACSCGLWVGWRSLELGGSQNLAPCDKKLLINTQRSEVISAYLPRETDWMEERGLNPEQNLLNAMVKFFLFYILPWEVAYS